jgi:hypothetical protein
MTIHAIAALVALGVLIATWPRNPPGKRQFFE